MKTYSEYQDAVSSEKLTLAIVHASKRLMGWSLHSGSIYKISNLSVEVIVSIIDSGTAYAEASDISGVTASKYFYDQDAGILYLRTTGSDNPNGRFIVLKQKLFFANAPITLPHDLTTGTEVYFEPMLKSTSAFGVEIDTVNQTSEAIEGSGTLTLVNDNAFWLKRYDKLFFENQSVYIYSHNRQLDPNQAKLIFQGYIEKKTYSPSQIQFTLKDVLSILRTPVPLANIENLGARTPANLAQAKQRLLYGKLYGYRPTNIDQVLDGYPITGTVSVAISSTTVTGIGTLFMAELSPDDTIVLAGAEYKVATITNNVSLTITEVFTASASLAGVSSKVIPDQPKRYINRVWKVAGHAVRQPSCLIEGTTSSITELYVSSTTDIEAGDSIYIGTLGVGEIAIVDRVRSNKILRLSTSLTTIPTAGTTVMRPGIQNVRIDDVLLRYYRDYTFDAETATLTLRTSAERDAKSISRLKSNLSFTNGTSTVTGTGLNAIVRPGDLIGVISRSELFEVLSVNSDTGLTLRTSATFTASTTGTIKNLIFQEGTNVLTCDVLGRTLSGTSSGDLIKSAPSIVNSLLVDAGLTAQISNASFVAAEDVAFQTLGIAIPSGFEDTDAPTFRDTINKINKSVFGSLVQTEAFQLSYVVLRPRKATASLVLSESDVLSFTVNSTAEKVIKTAIVLYGPKEYDFSTGKESTLTSQKTSDTSQYLLGAGRERVFSSILVNEVDAQVYANRWAFILENCTSTMKIKTKTQAMSLEVGSILELNHRKLFERYGSNASRKLCLVESVKKTGLGVEIEATDLGNAFNRVANIQDNTANWSDSDEEQLLYGGFFTDAYGLIENDETSFGTNLIW